MSAAMMTISLCFFTLWALLSKDALTQEWFYQAALLTGVWTIALAIWERKRER